MAKTYADILEELNITQSTTLSDLMTLAENLGVVSQSELNKIRSVSVMPLPDVVKDKATELKQRMTYTVTDESKGAVSIINKRNVLINEIINKIYSSIYTDNKLDLIYALYQKLVEDENESITLNPTITLVLSAIINGSLSVLNNITSGGDIKGNTLQYFDENSNDYVNVTALLQTLQSDVDAHSSRLVGYIELSSESGTLNDAQKLELSKPECVIKYNSNYYQRENNNSFIYIKRYNPSFICKTIHIDNLYQYSMSDVTYNLVGTNMVVNTLGSDSIISPLSANQGKVLKGYIDVLDTDNTSNKARLDDLEGDNTSNKARLDNLEGSNFQSQIDALNAGQNLADMVGTKALLDAYDTTNLKSEDKVQVLVDETQSNASTVYKFNGTTFVYVGRYGQDGYTKAEADALLNAKANASEVYKKSETLSYNELVLNFNAKANKTDVYDKTQTYDKTAVNTLLNTKADANNVYTKSETYTKTEADALLNDKADADSVYTKNDVYTKTEAYSKTEVNGIVDNLVDIGYEMPYQDMVDIFDEIYEDDPIVDYLDELNGEVV